MDPSTKQYLIDIDQLSRERGGSIYLVGGTVRDHLLGKPSTDYDFAAPQAPEIARAFADKVQRTRVPLDETPGRETFRVVLHRDCTFDFTTLQGNSIEEDLAQRDFTINAMAVGLADFIEEKSTLIDPFNGRGDLKDKIIRVLPGSAFEDDPLRLLRAFRFAATLGFTIEPDTLEPIKAHRTRLNNVAKERVTYELLILFEAARSPIDLMEQTGLSEILFPPIAELKTRPGYRIHTTAWDDTLNRFKEMERLLLHPENLLEKHAQLIKDFLQKNHHYALLKWSALVSAMPSGKSSPFDLTQFLKEFRLSSDDIQFVERTLKFSAILLSDSRSAVRGLKEDSAIYNFIKQSGNELIASLLLSLADRLGKEQDIQFCIQLINRILDFYVEKYCPAQERPPLLDGDVLQERFKLTPSPLFKSILDRVEEARVLGTIQTPGEAEQLARELITSQ